VELFDNTLLTPTEYDTAVREFQREYSAVLSAIAEGLQQDTPLIEPVIVGPIIPTTISQSLDRLGWNGTTTTSLYADCYQDICLIEEISASQDISYPTSSRRPDILQQLYLTEPESVTETSSQVYCFEILDLVAALAEPSPINPISGEPFSDAALALLMERLGKEVKMYQRYLQTCNERREEEILIEDKRPDGLG
jgi:hypothetical protein